jgi:hypothetical protein
MRDLETVRSLEEGARANVLSAFEVAIHKSLCKFIVGYSLDPDWVSGR